MTDDFAARLAAYAAERGKPLEDMRPGEREAAERSVRLVMDREVKEAERAAEIAAQVVASTNAEHARLALLCDLEVFVGARLDADEAWAHNVLEDAGSDLHGIARRWLREVEAKRKLIAEIAPKIEVMAQEIWNEWGSPGFDVIDTETLLRGLAAVYSGHPDYQREWAPS